MNLFYHFVTAVVQINGNHSYDCDVHSVISFMFYWCWYSMEIVKNIAISFQSLMYVCSSAIKQVTHFNALLTCQRLEKFHFQFNYLRSFLNWLFVTSLNVHPDLDYQIRLSLKRKADFDNRKWEKRTLCIHKDVPTLIISLTFGFQLKCPCLFSSLSWQEDNP